VATVPVVGFSMGGWLAAETSSNLSRRVEKLALVNAVGLKVEARRSCRYFFALAPGVSTMVFYDVTKSQNGQALPIKPTPEEVELRENSQIMAQLLGWKPTCTTPKLIHPYGRVKSPTLVVWGKQDRLGATGHGEAYQKAIRGSELKLIDRCGHLHSWSVQPSLSRWLKNF